MQQVELVDVVISHLLNQRDASQIRGVAEQVGVALLQLEVFGDRNLVPDLRMGRDFAVVGLEQGE